MLLWCVVISLSATTATTAAATAAATTKTTKTCATTTTTTYRIENYLWKQLKLKQCLLLASKVLVMTGGSGRREFDDRCSQILATYTLDRPFYWWWTNRIQFQMKCICFVLFYWASTYNNVCDCGDWMDGQERNTRYFEPANKNKTIQNRIYTKAKYEWLSKWLSYKCR